MNQPVQPAQLAPDGPTGSGGDGRTGGDPAGDGAEALVPASLVELVLSRVRADIVSGVLAPGARIVEEQLTRRLRISRAPLREALRLLGQQGLVQHLPRRGVRVTELSETDVDELFELRTLLERFAVDTALGRARPLDLSGLDAALDDLATAAEHGEPLASAEAHRRFHLRIVELAGHRQLAVSYEPVIAKLQLYMAANLHREAEQSAAADGVVRHRRLRDALADGDRAGALHELDHHGARRFFH